MLVSAVGDEQEKIAALDAGADDYVTKPFAIGELLARLRAVLRRAGPAAEPVLEIGELTVDVAEARRHGGGERVHLTPHEFELLRVLAQNEGKLMTHKAILREVWGPALPAGVDYLHVYVSQLRRKIEPDPTRPRYILTEPGAGYRLVTPDVFRRSLGRPRQALDLLETPGRTGARRWQARFTRPPRPETDPLPSLLHSAAVSGAFRTRRALRAARAEADNELLLRQTSAAAPRVARRGARRREEPARSRTRDPLAGA